MKAAGKKEKAVPEGSAVDGMSPTEKLLAAAAASNKKRPAIANASDDDKPLSELCPSECNLETLNVNQDAPKDVKDTRSLLPHQRYFWKHHYADLPKIVQEELAAIDKDSLTPTKNHVAYVLCVAMCL